MSDKIKKSELSKILRVGERSINSYVENGILPAPSYPTYPETEMLFDRKDIARILGVKEIPDEPFIELCDAAKIIKCTEPNTTYLAKSGKIPSYRLKNIKGHKFLFLKSELKSIMRGSIEWNADFSNLFFKQFYLRAIFNEILDNGVVKDLKPNEMKAVRDIIIHKKTIAQLADDLKITDAGVRLLFQRACRRIYYRIKQIPDRLASMDLLIKDNIDLRNENDLLKSLVKENRLLNDTNIDVLKIRMVDLDISPRLLHIFKSVDIFNIGDMVKWSKRDLMKIRNFGVTTMREVENVIEKYNLKLATDKVFVYHD